MNVNLFYLAKPRLGGWVSFLSHFTRALKLAGVDATLYCVSNKTEVTLTGLRWRELTEGVHYHNVSPYDAIALAGAAPTMVTSCQKEHMATLVAMAARAPIALRVADTAEMRWLGDVMKAPGIRLHATRPAVVNALHREGVQAEFMPTAYFPLITTVPPVAWHAVAYSRLDWDKNTHLIVEANRKLKRDLRVRIFGAENRLYTHAKLDPVDPYWRAFYSGPYPSTFGAGAKLAAQARFAVDLSVISGEMQGGRQFTFLEAWDAGATLVVHRKWADSAGPVADGQTCLAVDTSQDLVRVLTETTEARRRELSEAGKAMLNREFDPLTVGRAYAQLLGSLR